MLPGSGVRLLQPNSSAPRAKHSVSLRLLHARLPTGSRAGSFFARNATGSMPSATASSSIAHSKPKNPGASAGARWKPGVFTSVAIVDSRTRMLGEAYMRAVTSVTAKATWSIVALCPACSCDTAVIVPSRSAASRTLLRVAGRNEPTVNIASRGTTSFTARPSRRAAIAISTVCGNMVALPPKPPPTYGHSTCTSSAGMPKIVASPMRVPITHWLGTCTSSLPSRHSAEVA